MHRIFAFFELHKITPNMFYTLIAIQNEKRPSIMNVHLEIRHLKNAKLITDNNKLSAKANELIKEGLKILDSSTPTVEQSQDMIRTYIELFPAKKLPSGKLARSAYKNIENCFKWFFSNYDYSWEIILKATAYYIDSYEKKNYLYMRNSQYFIVKTNPDKTRDSELANYCEIIQSGIDEENDSFFKEKVV
jgi:hypothetical protein